MGVKWPLLLFGGIVSVALLAFGCISAARSWPDVATSVGIGAGVVCLILVIFNQQIKRIVIKGSKDGIQIDLDLTKETREDLTKTGLAGLGSTYAFVHNQLANDEQSYAVKVRLQDQLVTIAQQNAFEKPVDAPEIKQILTDGSAGERVLVFGLLTANTRLATVPFLLQGITNSKSGNEQYHALLAVEASWDELNADARRQLVAAIRAANFIGKDSDRRKVADRILKLAGDA